MAGFMRPSDGWRYEFEGMNTREVPDALKPGQYPIAINIRAVAGKMIQTRPGYTPMFSTAALPITDIRAYAALNTDNLPRLLVRNTDNEIYLDDGSLVSTLAGSSQGVFMIPYRPNQSPQSWMYIGAQGDYRKLSAPDADDAVVDYAAGIEEQQSAPDACPEPFNYYNFSALAADWANSGTAGAISDGVSSCGTCGDIFTDPASGSNPRYSVEVDDSGLFKIGMVAVFDTAGLNISAVVQDVLPPVNNSETLLIESILYYDQDTNTGRCVIVPSQMSTSGISFTDGIPSAASIFSTSALASLRRGSIVELNDGSSFVENCMVLSVTSGPNGTVCFEVETVATYAAGHAITGIPAISVSGIAGIAPTDTIDSNHMLSVTTVGTATLSQALAVNPFTEQLPPSTNTPQQADYFHISLQFNAIENVTSGRIKFHTGGTALAEDFFYYDFTPETLAGGDDNAPNYTWLELWIPISSLQHSSNDITRTLVNCDEVEISLVVTGAGTPFYYRDLWIGGGGQPDVGEEGSPYFYTIVGRSPLTGALSNPSPITRYGVNPRRQNVRVTITDTVNDPQLTRWDVYRFGGTITSFRYIGSMPNTGGEDEFIDQYFDDAANAGRAIEYDNFQPWPSVGLPFNIQAGTVDGVTLTITVTGTVVSLLWTSALAFADPTEDMSSWLPGTLIQIGSQSAYTLRSRPETITYGTPPANFYYARRLELVENAGSLAADTMSVQEPFVANQHLPYLFGPDANGTVFACGDPLRPGNLYYAKTNSPDSAPDTYNQEITPPSEPLMGGETINGLAVVASTERWWSLYPNFNSTVERYQAVQRPVGRGLAAPYGHCTDGNKVWFWAKDGIWVDDGGAGQSLTDDDLYNLFPHDGVEGENYEYATYTIYAPDYKYAAGFRLSYINSYLYADYQDADGTYRTLVCDLRNGKPRWSMDQTAENPITVHYAVEQQAGTLLTDDEAYSKLILGNVEGNVYQEAKNSNDDGNPITSALLTFEFNGGDVRADQFWSDVYLDSTPNGVLTMGPVSEGVQIGTPLVIPQSAARGQNLVSVGAAARFLGLSCQWVDNFSTQPEPTKLYAWQPMFQSMPVGVLAWKTQGTSFGLVGFMHLREIVFAYISNSEVTITIDVYDGTAPAAVTLPSTGGVLKKVLFPVTFNKGQLFFLTATSSAIWYPFLSECEFHVGQWDRTTRYIVFRDIEGPRGIGEGLNAPNRGAVVQN